MAGVPVEFVFNPNWWFRNYGIPFDQSFYLDREARIRNDVRMRRALYERFGLGEADPQPRPIVGSQQVAGGFVLPALYGVEIRFAPNDAPWPVPRSLSAEEILALRPPDWQNLWPMKCLIGQMDELERDFGCLVGDFDLDGVLNTALHLRGQQLFLDLYDAPEVADHLFRLITNTQIEVARYVKSRTGTNSVAVNRSILNVDPRLFLHSNCSVQMMSPRLYERFLLPCEKTLARELAPFGVHHCGNNLHLFAASYSQVPCAFFDVGWGSDVARCREAFPNAFLNLRLSPVRLLEESAATVRRDAESLLAAAGSTVNVGLCAINLDHGTPDENVRAVLQAAAAA